MTNHIHLVASAPLGPSEFMRRLLGGYTVGYNTRHARDGPLFKGRYVSVQVETDAQLPTLVRYVHRNPLSIVSKAALAAYRYSSYGVYLGRGSAPAWLLTDVVLGGASASAHRAFVETDLPHDEVGSARWSCRVPPSLSELEDLVAVGSGVASVAIRAGTAGRRNDARMLAVMLAVELRLAPAIDLALHFGLGSADAVRTLARRGRVRAADDRSFAALRSSVPRDLDLRKQQPDLFGA